jgi:hypothetical protein
MDNMTLKCPITVKAKVTEKLKSQMATEIQDALKKADMELQQIDFHAKRIMAEQAKVDAGGLTALRQQIDAEKQKRLDFKAGMNDKLKEASQLELGAEIVQGTLERIITVNIGEDLHKLLAAELVVEDGKIIAFRE